MHLHNIKIGHEEIPAFFSESIHETVNEILATVNKNKFIVIFDVNLPGNIADFFECMSQRAHAALLPIEVTEKNKNICGLEGMLSRLLEMGVDRNTCLIAIGGGVLENMVGMAAGLLYRGIDMVHVPTTLIACADSTISLKQAINFGAAKNIVGLYYSPKGVFTCMAFLRTLPREEVSAGYVEYVKNLVTLIPEATTGFLESEFDPENIHSSQIVTLILNSIAAKEQVLKDDPKERNRGLILEYGHTVGHALEILTGGELRHGEGVAIGILVSSDVACNHYGLCPKAVALQWKLIEKIGIFRNLICKVDTLLSIDYAQLMECIKNDNKRGRILCSDSEIPMVVLSEIAKPVTTSGCCLIAVQEQVLLESIKHVFLKIHKYCKEADDLVST